MKQYQNEGKADRIIRFFLSIATAVASYYTHGTARVVWIIVTIILLVSSLSGFALPYKILGISTKKK